jgi:hypothetical protein
VSVITRELHKIDAHGKQRKTQTTIEFTIVAISKASDAAGLNMEEAIVRGKEALDSIEPAASSFEPIPWITNALVNDIKSVSNTWDPLLQKVKLFTELVDEVAEVRD